MIQKINQYGLLGIIKMLINLIRTKLTFQNARIIRFPIDIRGKKFIQVSKGFTTGVGCRIEAYPKTDKKVLFFGENFQPAARYWNRHHTAWCLPRCNGFFGNYLSCQRQCSIISLADNGNDPFSSYSNTTFGFTAGRYVDKNKLFCHDDQYHWNCSCASEHWYIIQ